MKTLLGHSCFPALLLTFLNYQFGDISLRSMFLSYDILIRACRNEKSMKCQVLSPHCTRGPSHRSLSHDFHYLRVDSFCFFIPGVRAPSVSFESRLTLLSATVGFLESTESLFCFGDQVRPNGDGKLRTFQVFVARLTGTSHNNKTETAL